MREDGGGVERDVASVTGFWFALFGITVCPTTLCFPVHSNWLQKACINSSHPLCLRFKKTKSKPKSQNNKTKQQQQKTL